MQTDKKAYLDQIAVKDKAKGKGLDIGSIFTPFVIKLIVAGLILTITLVVCGNLLHRENNALNESYQKLHLKLFMLSDSSSPIYTYEDKIRSSDLRSYTSSLRSVLKTQKSSIDAAIAATGVSLTQIPEEITSAETLNMTQYEYALEDAVLNGNLDKIYATETLYQLTILISTETSVRSQTDSKQLAAAIDDSINNLTSIQELLQKYINTH